MLVLRWLAILALVSCAAALVPESRDPQTKLNQAATLFQNGRPVGALTLVKQAVPLFEEKKDQEGLARAYLAYGDIYKAGVNNVEPILPNFTASAESYVRAAEIYHSMKFFLSESMYLWFAGSMYGKTDKKAEACSAIARSIKAYDPKAIDKTRYEHTEALPERINLEAKKQGCP